MKMEKFADCLAGPPRDQDEGVLLRMRCAILMRLLARRRLSAMPARKIGTLAGQGGRNILGCLVRRTASVMAGGSLFHRSGGGRCRDRKAIRGFTI